MGPITRIRDAVRHNASHPSGCAAAHCPGRAAAGHPADASAGTEPVVSLREAAVRVGGRTLWSHVRLDVRPGEFVAVLGPNGVGKSTLIKAVLGLVPLAAGEISVLGERPGQLAHLVGYLPQRRSFDASLRIRGTDIVRLGWDGDRWGLPGPRSARAARARIAEVLALVGASAYADRPIGQCSGGEQQRLLIAQALIRRPRLLLLDEPLDSLDLPNQAAVAALIGRICREEGVSVMMVAHDANPILGHLDRVVYLAEGGAVAGTPAEVITSETLTRLYRTPIEVLRTSDGRLVVVGQPEPAAVHTDRHTVRQSSAGPTEALPEAIPLAPTEAPSEAPADVPPPRGAGHADR
ncbi:metal ABC transporter ATP-binding protein [Streptomyces sp. NBC_01190]|uniref:metal ABC transporter ATP-binding protein n=1 Tax=Streptomyces sp. NBC_01190 TaxID=2903767 RepID=UPI0038644657|nr:ATP-binding cassette domain-containing protein [Streptomyces sp. NBC_01190]